MEALTDAIYTTPIIDNHAHNLLLPSYLGSEELLSITSEANGEALQHTPSTLAHLRAVKQLAEVLKCEPKWEVVQQRIDEERKISGDAWAKRCFQGIETVLIDDGLDEHNVYSYDWHDRLTRSKCKRVVRIENILEDLITGQKEDFEGDAGEVFDDVCQRFVRAIEKAILDDEVVGFKSIIAYRSGLGIITPLQDLDRAKYGNAFQGFVARRKEGRVDEFSLEDATLGSHLVHLVAKAISFFGVKQGKLRKPFQFHTGLGDRDEDLRLSNPLFMKPFIESYPDVPIVLLHASYPFTKSAGYLASVYENVYLDIGEVFPMISQEGQETILREALDLCPTEKMMWSTDGHWYPEGYLLAIIQIREALDKVLKQNLVRQTLTVPEAIRVVKDILFNTSNRLYGLEIPFSPLVSSQTLLKGSNKADELALFTTFLEENPSVKYLRVQWLDYTNTLKVRVVPIKQALHLFGNGSYLTMFPCLPQLQDDHLAPGYSPIGIINLKPCFDSIRLGARSGHATVQAEFLEANAVDEAATCPRTLLRKMVEKAQAHGLEFKVGFEIEVVFLAFTTEKGKFEANTQPISHGHFWSTSRSLQVDTTMNLLEEIVDTLLASGIAVEHFHAEACFNQYEFVTGPLPPLAAVDALLATREIISTVAARHNLRATIVPKPITNGIGTGAHMHMSFTPEDHYLSFYAGILMHLRALTAFSQPHVASYDRTGDGNWSGGTWIAWGDQNRETPLRRVEGAHWEIKCIDGLANMYLTLAAIIAVGLQGWIERLPMEINACDREPANLSDHEREDLGIVERMPSSFGGACNSLEENEFLREVLGEECIEMFLQVKQAEMKNWAGWDDDDERSNWLIERY